MIKIILFLFGRKINLLYFCSVKIKQVTNNLIQLIMKKFIKAKAFANCKNQNEVKATLTNLLKENGYSVIESKRGLKVVDVDEVFSMSVNGARGEEYEIYVEINTIKEFVNPKYSVEVREV